MFVGDDKSRWVINDKDREVWEWIKDISAKILHLKVKLMREYMARSPYPAESSSQLLSFLNPSHKYELPFH
jgi:glucose-6-phosphate 1-dehydrogenase